MYMVVDTWVFAKIATGIESSDNLWNDSLLLIALIAYYCEHKVVIDHEGEILSEYENVFKKLLEGRNNFFMNVQTLIRRFVSTGKIIRKARIPLPKRVYDKILEIFDKSDLKFVEVALSIPSNEKIIISGDSDFIKLRDALNNDEELRRYLKGIKILTPGEAASLIEHKKRS